MNAKVPVKAKLTKREQKIILEFAHAEMQKQREDMMRRFFKLMALALREPFSPKGSGMGVERINKVINRIAEYADKSIGNKEFWEEVDHVVIDRMGLLLTKEPSSGEKVV